MVERFTSQMAKEVLSGPFKEEGKQKCQGKVNSSNVCFIHRRGRGRESSCFRVAVTGSSCVQSGSSMPQQALRHGKLWRGLPPIWPEVLHLGHLGGRFAGSG